MPYYNMVHIVHLSLQVLVFDSGTFLLETVLEGRGEPVWQVRRTGDGSTDGWTYSMWPSPAGGGRDGRGDGGDGELPHRVEETQARGQVGGS